MKVLLLLALLISVGDCQSDGTSSGTMTLIIIFGVIGIGGALCGLCYSMFYCNADGSYKRRPGCGSDSTIDLAGIEDDTNKNQCYLCLAKVPTSEWKSGEHRRVCARGNAELLKDLKTVELLCQQCRDPLRLWPRIGCEFYCDAGYSCGSHGKGIVNTGINRFNCFQCDIDLCLPCVENKLNRRIDFGKSKNFP